MARSSCGASIAATLAILTFSFAGYAFFCLLARIMRDFPAILCSSLRQVSKETSELEGFGRQGSLLWKEKLQALGYRLSAQIIGWPGDVCVHLSWRQGLRLRRAACRGSGARAFARPFASGFVSPVSGLSGGAGTIRRRRRVAVDPFLLLSIIDRNDRDEVDNGRNREPP